MRNTENKNGWKLWVGLGAGLIAGAAAGWFYNSDQGRKARKEAKRWTRDVDRMVRHEMEDLKAKAEDALDRTKEYAEKAKTTLKEKFEQFSNS